jgi:predicted  nucleic acid-binding Zn-ribbon protein
MSQTLSLYRLQQVDNQIDRLQTRLKDIQKLLDDDVELRQLNEKAEAAKARCQTAEQALRQAERYVQEQQIKIEQTQASLYGSKSHSPKELQDLQNDVAALRRHLVTLEDQQIDAMQESENAESDQVAIQTRLNAAKDERAEFWNSLHREQGVLTNDLDRFFVERNAVAGAIPAAELSLYDQLRHQRKGVAVAVISDNSCEACGSTLSLAQIQSARSSGQVVFCPSCGRILYGS